MNEPTQKEKRVSIAKACGLCIYERGPFKERDSSWSHWCLRCGEAEGAHELPDYFNDLNACHEMEKVLTEDQREQYGNILAEEIGSYKTLWWPVLHATSFHRCEAFGKTLGLW